MPRLLELCSGTGSVGRAFAARGWDVVSVDCDPRANASICCDLLELTAERCCSYGPVHFVWASPPCTFYSIARTTGPPADLDAADRLVQKCLDLAAELGAPFIMENPWTGKLKNRPVVQGIPMRTCDYCMYGAAYRKRTALWTNTEFTPSRPEPKDFDFSCVPANVHKERSTITSRHSLLLRLRWYLIIFDPLTFVLDQ